MVEKINILMVDDQPGKLLSYEAALNDLGENLIEDHSGSEVLNHLLKTDIAIILMDVNMPGMDGFELAAMIHQHPRFQDIAIILVSVQTGVELRGMPERMRRLGGTLEAHSDGKGT